MRATIVLLLSVGAALGAANSRIVSDEFLQTLKEKATTWTPRRNFPADTPTEYLKNLAGVIGKRNPNSNSTLPLVKHEIRAAAAASFDSRDVWGQCASLRTIRNQGACGGCWAFSAVEVMSDRLCIFTGGAQQFVFSPEELISCCTDCGFGCGGGYMVTPYEYWSGHGVPSGGDQDSGMGCRPYTARDSGQTPGCNQRCVNGADYSSDLRHGVTAYEVTPTVDQIQHEISINGPVGTIFHVFEDFYNYGGGIYQYTYGAEIGWHAVKIIGWGEENGVPYWTVANSWGEGWGEGGFFKIVRGRNDCEIESSVPAGIPNTLEKA